MTQPPLGAPLSEERVREYEQMLSAVTPGPWTPGGVFFREGGAAIQNIWGPRRAEAQSGHLVAQQALMADAAFIAASPTIVSALLSDRAALSARVEELERENEKLRGRVLFLAQLAKPEGDKR